MEISHIFDKSFVKEVTKELISRNIFSVGENFAFFHTVGGLSLSKHLNFFSHKRAEGHAHSMEITGILSHAFLAKIP